MVDQAPAGITFKNEHGLDCVLVAIHIEDAHEFEAHIADESDLRAAGFVQLSPGSDGPTREDIQSAYDAAYLASEQAGERYPHDDAKRSLYNAGRAEGLALGEQKQAARVAELEAELAEYREQVHQENLLKADLDAAESELAAMKEKLAEVERELEVEKSRAIAFDDEARESAAELQAQRVVTIRARRSEMESERTAVQLRSELASARRVVWAARSFVAWLSGAWSGPETLNSKLSNHPVAGTPYRYLKQALASAGTDADRAEAPRPEAGEPRRICYEHGPYERRCPACATEEPQPSAPERQPEVERDDGGEQE